MSDTPSIALALRSVMPLQISAVEYEHPTLVVIGEHWSLALVGPWQWRREGISVTAYGGPDTEDTVWDLCGLAVTDAHFADANSTGVCSFRLSDGGSLDTQSDRSGYETWTLRHDDLDRILVGIG